MSIIDRYLKKKFGVKSFSELNEEERETYKEWEQSLSGRRLTDDDVAKFLAAELEDILDKLPKAIDGSRLDMFLKMKLDFVRSIQRFLALPKMEKEAAEKMIEQMMKV